MLRAQCGAVRQTCQLIRYVSMYSGGPGIAGLPLLSFEHGRIKTSIICGPGDENGDATDAESMGEVWEGCQFPHLRGERTVPPLQIFGSRNA